LGDRSLLNDHASKDTDYNMNHNAEFNYKSEEIDDIIHEFERHEGEDDLLIESILNTKSKRDSLNLTDQKDKEIKTNHNTAYLNNTIVLRNRLKSQSGYSD